MTLISEGLKNYLMVIYGKKKKKKKHVVKLKIVTWNVFG